MRALSALLLPLMLCREMHADGMERLLKRATEPLCDKTLAEVVGEGASRRERELARRIAISENRLAGLAALFGRYAPFIAVDVPYEDFGQLPRLRPIALIFDHLGTPRPIVAEVLEKLSHNGREYYVCRGLKSNASTVWVYIDEIRQAYPVESIAQSLLSSREIYEIEAIPEPVRGLDLLQKGEFCRIEFRQGR